MPRVSQIYLALAACFLLMSEVQGALESRLNGQAVYDTDLNITWLADVNYPKTSGYDPDGLMTWSSANAWAKGLVFKGVDTWRLPTTKRPDKSCARPNISVGAWCKGSEMGHLFYSELGGTFGNHILKSTDPDLSLFQNLEPIGGDPAHLFYWSETWAGTNLGGGQNYYWFSYYSGFQSNFDENFVGIRAMAVADGDVFAPAVGAIGLIPVLLVAALGPLARISRKRQ